MLAVAVQVEPFCVTAIGFPAIVRVVVRGVLRFPRLSFVHSVYEYVRAARESASVAVWARPS